MARWLQAYLVFLAPGVAGEFWTVSSGECTVDGDCLESPNFPQPYGLNHYCVIEVNENSWEDHEIEADSNFYTEGCCDELEINADKYSGTRKPDGVVPEGTIIFTSDDSNPDSDLSWRLCPKYVGSGDPNDGGTTSGSSSNVGMIIGAVAGGVVVVLLLCCAAFVLMKLRAQASSKTSVVVTAASGPSASSGAPAVSRDSDEQGEGGGAANWIRNARTSVYVPETECVPPGYWSIHMLHAGQVNYQSVTSFEQESVQLMIDGTFKNIRTRDRHSEVPKRLKMVQVQRIENSDLWKRYLSGRYAIRNKRSHRCTPMTHYGGEAVTLPFLFNENKRSLSPGINEMYLFHGTTPGGAMGISKQGFSLSYSGTRAGSMYGSGVYLAECSSKSDEYAGDDSEGVYKGLYCLLLCRAVLGEVLNLPVGGSTVHETVRVSMESGAFDSTLGNREASVGTYREFIVYQEDQVYPEYLIIYKREM